MAFLYFFCSKYTFAKVSVINSSLFIFKESLISTFTVVLSWGIIFGLVSINLSINSNFSLLEVVLLPFISIFGLSWVLSKLVFSGFLCTVLTEASCSHSAKEYFSFLVNA